MMESFSLCSWPTIDTLSSLNSQSINYIVYSTLEDTDKLLIHGGHDLYNLHEDTWLFDTDTLTWTCLYSASSASPDDASSAPPDNASSVPPDNASRAPSDGASSVSPDDASLRGTDPPSRYFHSVVVHGNSMCVIG